jgi:ketosteroid isomerase-like protein
MAESNKDIIREGYDAFNRQDIPGTLELFDENIEWTEPEMVYGPPGGTWHGRDEVLHKVFEPIAEHFDSFTLEPRELYGDGDTVVVVGSFKLRPKGVLQTLDVPFAHVWRLRNGKAVSMRNYVDVGELYERKELRRAA